MKALAAMAALLLTGSAQSGFVPLAHPVFLVPVVWVPAFAVFARIDGMRALLAGWLVGATAVALGFSWIADTVSRFSSLSAPAAAAVLAAFSLASGLYAGLFAWGFGRVRRAAGRGWPLGVALWFTACEFAYPQIFPYAQGHAWYQLPQVFLVSALTGISGVTFLAIWCNASVLQALEVLRDPGGDRRACATNAALLAVAIAGTLAWSAHREAVIERAEAEVAPLRVALVQPNYDVERRRAMRRMEPDIFARDLVSLSSEALARDGDIDVFIWPEGALAGDPREPRNTAVREFARAAGVEIWTGANVRPKGTGRRKTHNSAYRIGPDGAVDARYDKTLLIPFGEYMPFEGAIPALRRIRGPGDFARGEGIAVYRDGPARFAFLICYEAIQSAYVRGGMDRKPELLVNVTFDAWFGDTAEPVQHLQLAAVQSAHYGVPLLRSTTTGISAFVDARGVIRDQTRVFTREVLVRDVKPVHVPSPYGRFGDWFGWGCVAAGAGLLLRSRRRGD
ncbi:MAG: apolipoprotein N-acyltransferase [Myxococcota bacterium]